MSRKISSPRWSPLRPYTRHTNALLQTGKPTHHSLPLAPWRRQCGQAGQREGERGCSRHGRENTEPPASMGRGSGMGDTCLENPPSGCFLFTPLPTAGSMVTADKRVLWTCVSRQVKGSLVLNLQGPTLRSQLYTAPPLALPSTDQLLHPKFEHTSLRKAVFEKPALVLSLTPSPE